MADEKLIEKIMLQVAGLLRANMAEIIENFQELAKEISEPKLIATLKIRLKKKEGKGGIVYDSAIQWNKGLKRGDVSDAEIYDTDTPDMFELGAENFQKIADKNNAEISVYIGGKEIPLAKPKKMKDKI